MPMIDVTIPEGALKPEAEARLIKELTDILIAHEGFDAGNKVAQSVTVVFLHRPAAVYVAGAVRRAALSHRPDGAGGPVHRRHPQGAGEGRHRCGGPRRRRKYEDVAPHVWVFPTEIPDGQWGSRGVIRPLPDIQAFIAGEQNARSATNALRGVVASRRSSCSKARSMLRARAASRSPS